MIKLVQCKTATTLLLVFLCVACERREQPRRGGAKTVAGNFDYYVLALSWAPTFCENPEHRNARECDPARNTGFVIHGLWPQRENGRSPEYCGNAQPLGGSARSEALALMPDAGLARHEWGAHGTCSGLSPSEYFGAMKEARQSVRIPAPYRSPQRGLRTSASAVEQQFARASGITQHGAIHVHCVRDELAEVRFCFTKSLAPRPCGENVGECRANTIFMRPVR